MTGNETLSEDEFLDAVTSSFFDWIWDEFLPILIMAVFLAAFVFGILFNVILLVVSAKNGWLKEPVHAFIIHMCIIDLIACAFIVLPTLISVKRESSAFPETQSSCNFQHVVFTLCAMLTFLFIATGVMERAVRSVSTAQYVKTFGNTCCVFVIIISLWIFGIAVSLLSLVKQEVKYDKDLFQCVVRYAESPSLMNFLFSLWYFLPTLVVVACFAIIVHRRGQQVNDVHSRQRQKNEDFTDSTPHPHIHATKEESTSVFYIDKYSYKDNTPTESLYVSNAKIGILPNKDEVDVGNIMKSHGGQSGLRVFKAKKKWKSVAKRVKKQGTILQVFRDKPDDINHHQTMTYLLTWVVMTLCWLIYVIAMYLDVYSGRCSACLKIGVLIGQSSYSCKPLIYIGHNRWYRSTFIKTIKAMFCKRNIEHGNRA